MKSKPPAPASHIAPGIGLLIRRRAIEQQIKWTENVHILRRRKQTRCAKNSPDNTNHQTCSGVQDRHGENGVESHFVKQGPGHRDRRALVRSDQKHRGHEFCNRRWSSVEHRNERVGGHDDGQHYQIWRVNPRCPTPNISPQDGGLINIGGVSMEYDETAQNKEKIHAGVPEQEHVVQDLLRPILRRVKNCLCQMKQHHQKRGHSPAGLDGCERATKLVNLHRCNLMHGSMTVSSLTWKLI
jgi:hypothetical protein